MNLCRETAFREGLSDPEFWEKVLLGEQAPGPDYDIDLDDIEQIQGSSCTACGAVGACAYDVDGRPMIHTTEDDET
jgi:hypothetical protein